MKKHTPTQTTKINNYDVAKIMALPEKTQTFFFVSLRFRPPAGPQNIHINHTYPKSAAKTSPFPTKNVKQQSPSKDKHVKIAPVTTPHPPKSRYPPIPLYKLPQKFAGPGATKGSQPQKKALKTAFPTPESTNLQQQKKTHEQTTNYSCTIVSIKLG